MPGIFSDADTLDIAGVRKDGGLDLVISAGGAISSDLPTLELLQLKVRNYLAAADKLKLHYGVGPAALVSISIVCPYSIDPEAWKLIRQLQVFAAEQQVALEVRERMGD